MKKTKLTHINENKQLQMEDLFKIDGEPLFEFYRIGSFKKENKHDIEVVPITLLNQRKEKFSSGIPIYKIKTARFKIKEAGNNYIYSRKYASNWLKTNNFKSWEDVTYIVTGSDIQEKERIDYHSNKPLIQNQSKVKLDKNQISAIIQRIDRLNMDVRNTNFVQSIKKLLQNNKELSPSQYSNITSIIYYGNSEYNANLLTTKN